MAIDDVAFCDSDICDLQFPVWWVHLSPPSLTVGRCRDTIWEDTDGCRSPP
ncbi:hypothetical protein TIFTF001_016092 [Ficus carica]|uniref:Uncharacterized protein n=1 Tax=Ficus carica TaxID=3494 RepID=A0AA88AMZ1_FICCA|nr:hypothetical protein TIFTF001_016092 [Ficus carica]